MIAYLIQKKQALTPRSFRLGYRQVGIIIVEISQLNLLEEICHNHDMKIIEQKAISNFDPIKIKDSWYNFIDNLGLWIFPNRKCRTFFESL